MTVALQFKKNGISIALMLAIILSGQSLTVAKTTSKAARKHYVLGNQYYEQERIKEAIQEWTMALQIDPDLEQANDKIKKANYYLKHGKHLEEQTTEAGPDLAAKEAETLTEEIIVKPRANVPMERVQAEILEIERKGGKVTKIIIGAGSQHGMRIGLDGIISELNGSPLAGFRITAVDATKCLAEVIGLSRDVSNTAIALINRPK